MTEHGQTLEKDENRFAEAFEKAIFELLGQIPETDEPCSDNPTLRARAIARAAARRAAVLSGTLSLAPGPLGWLTVLPDLLAVWRVQQEMVAQIAAAFGRTSDLGQEEMFYCLFRHMRRMP